MSALDRARSLFIGCPNGLMTARADWLRKEHGQDAVYSASAGLFRLLARTEEGPAADEIRDELDAFWYAMDEGTRKEMTDFLAADKDKESGDGDDDVAP